MQCPCGGETTNSQSNRVDGTQKVTRACIGCGRVHWVIHDQDGKKVDWFGKPPENKQHDLLARL